MVGVIFSIIAGIAMSLQGVFNTRLSERAGLWETNLLVQGGAFLLSVLAWVILANGSIGAIRETNRLYLCGGVLGLVITVSVMLGIKGLSPAASIPIILAAQLIAAWAISLAGLFDTPKVPLDWRQIAGAAAMIGGILLMNRRK
ncbi:MAG: DMT family transporter [Clostridia bacterium]|nr:DMT family transporter [Clostridia bacterium]